MPFLEIWQRESKRVNQLAAKSESERMPWATCKPRLWRCRKDRVEVEKAAWEGRWEPCAGRKQTHGWFTPSSILVQFQALLCVFQTILFSDLISSHCEFCGVIWACLNQEGLTETIFLHFYVKYLQIWSITFLISKWMWKSDIPKERTRTHWARKSYFSSYMQKILSASVSLRKSALQEPQT